MSPHSELQLGQNPDSPEDPDFDGYNTFADSDSDIANTPADPGPDIANTHARNEELREREATKSCFEIFDKLESLENKESRGRIGSMPNEWSNEAIPLFEHDGADYQLHLSHTWIKGIHTYANGSESVPEEADLDVYGLAGFNEWYGYIDIITWPLVVIPLGKLFVNKSGYSTWTGYELFLSGSLEVWMMYVPTKHDTVTWNTVDTGLFAHPGDRFDRIGDCKLALFCRSLRDLKTTTFEAAKKEVETSQQRRIKSLYLLEISDSDIGEFINLSRRHSSESHQGAYPPRDVVTRKEVVLTIENLNLGPGLARSQLMLLAMEKSEDRFVRFTPGAPDSWLEEEDSLLRAAVYKESWRIVDIILSAVNAHDYATGWDFSDCGIYHSACGPGREALLDLVVAYRQRSRYPRR